jgi:hypothetical protein
MGCIQNKNIVSENSNANRFEVIFADTDNSVYYDSQLEINGEFIGIFNKFLEASSDEKKIIQKKNGKREKVKKKIAYLSYLYHSFSMAQ